jgi:hypothetical protein
MSKIKIIRYDEEIFSELEAQKLPYYQRLLQIRSVLENNLSRFPLNYCSFAARVVNLKANYQKQQENTHQS